MVFTAFVLGGAPCGVEDEFTLMLPSRRPMIFQDFEAEFGIVWACCRRLSITLLTMPQRRNVPRCCAISFFARLVVLRRALLGDPPALKKPVAVRLHACTRVVPTKPPSKCHRLLWSAADSCCNCRFVMTTSSSSRCPGKGLRRRGVPEIWCRACLLARAPCCKKHSRRCG